MEMFKGRTLDTEKPVQVYRNLNDRTGERVWSIRQNGLVIAHTKKIYLGGVRFVVNKAGWRRMRREGRRNVHAYATGMVIDSVIVRGALPNLIFYNKERARFESHNLSPAMAVKAARYVAFNRWSVRAAELEGGFLRGG